MTEALLGIPSHVRRRLISALETGILAPPYSVANLQTSLGLREGAADVVGALEELARMGVSGTAAAAWIRTSEAAASRTPTIDLVWTGPEVPGVHARDTRRVYEELLGSAQHSIWASSYAYFDGPRAFEVLARRMESIPGLEVTLLLNIQRTKGVTAPSDHVIRQFADRFWQRDWPGTSRPRVYFDPRSLNPDGPTGVLHAKVVIADRQSVFVTSANLTEAAWDRNVELGLLVRDPALAESIISHFTGLIDRSLLTPLPSS